MELKQEDFYDVIKNKRILVDFYATWCGPCKMQSQALEIANLDIEILKVDVDNHPDLAREFGVMSIPTLILFDNGEIKHKNVGFTAPDEIKKWLED